MANRTVPATEFLPPRRTKLRPPRLANDLIARPHLVARLNQLAATSLIIAPAGYGKTTLINMWLAQLEIPSAWISLDAEDDEVSIFLTDIVTALGPLLPPSGEDIIRRLTAFHQQPIAELIVLLLNELDTIDRPFVLVLDDYHWIHNAEIHQIVVLLLTHPPRNLHLMITARHDPPLPWHLRVGGSVCEIRAQDLSFSESETAAFLAKVTERTVPAQTARFLTEQSEGWATGLRLAALYARRTGADFTASSLLRDSRQNAGDYFVSEVISYLSDSVRSFLVRTSILDTLNGPLCDFVLDDIAERSHGAALLRQLEADGVFTTALDNSGVWYSLHPLFRHALRLTLQELYTPEEVARLYDRAVVWHEGHGFWEEAIRYALAARQVPQAVAVVRRHRHALLNTMDFPRLARWLRLFPTSAVAGNPDLLLTKAWLMQVRFEIPDMRDCMEQVESLLDVTDQDTALRAQWESEVAVLRSQLFLRAGEVDAVAVASLWALQSVPPDHFYIRSSALLYLAFALYMSGESASLDSLLDNAAADSWVERDLALLRSQQIRHFIQLMSADFLAMRAEFPRMLQLADARKLKTSLAWAHYFWGCAGYLQNSLSEAEEHFRAVLALADYCHAGAYTHAAIGLALTRQAMGAAQEASAIVESTRSYLRDLQLTQMQQVLNAFAVELSVRQGRTEEGTIGFAMEAQDLVVDAMPMFYIPGLAPVKVLIEGQTQSDRRTAQLLLMHIQRIAVQTRNIHCEIQALALQAVLSDADGNREQAHAALLRAMALAAPGGVIRIFADLSPQLAPLLAQLPANDLPPVFVAQIRGAVERDLPLRTKTTAALPRSAPKATNLSDRAVEGAQIGNPARPLNVSEELNLHQVLTYREMDVLRLLDKRLTNKEIARQLGISTETVRQHTVKLFRKLHVNNRRQAIVAAHALGLFAEAK